MMTQNEIVNLLSVMTAYDSRNASKAAVLAWGTAAELGRWTFSEALRSVHAHYAESTDFIMPAHVTKRIKAIRQDAAMREPIDPPDPVGQTKVAAAITGIFQTVGERPESSWMKVLADAKRETQERRRRVLAHPDIAAKLTEPPLSLTDPVTWNGYIPPRTLPGDDDSPHDAANDSPVRRQLVAIAAEALRREVPA